MHFLLCFSCLDGDENVQQFVNIIPNVSNSKLYFGYVYLVVRYITRIYKNGNKTGHDRKIV